MRRLAEAVEKGSDVVAHRRAAHTRELTGEERTTSAASVLRIGSIN
jgi:hypothetical protein